MRGPVLLKAGAATHELRFTTNALCWLEEVSGRGLNDLVGSFQADARLTDVRLILCAALGMKDPALAGDVIDDAGLVAVSEAIGKALKLAFPDVDEGDVKKVTAAA